MFETPLSVAFFFGDRVRTLFEIQDQIATALVQVPDVRLHILNENGSRDVQISVLGDSEAARGILASVETIATEIEKAS